jgi:TetR/AcrR family transcriptional regulator, cholesterol catabolism regulator
MPRRRDDEQYDARRREILDAAVRLFRTKGYESARLEDVAEELGATKAFIYYYFPKKVDLLLEICHDAINNAAERQARILSSDAPPDERLRLAIEDPISFMESNAAVWSVFFREFELVSASDPRRRAIAKRLTDYGRHLEDLIKEGIAYGVFRPVDPRIVTNAILGMVNWSHRWIHGTDPARVSREFVALLEHGLLRDSNDGQAAAGSDARPP